MKKCAAFLGVIAVLCAGFGNLPANEQNLTQQDAGRDRYRITLPTMDELEKNLTDIGEALSRLADAFQIERIPAESSAESDT